MSAFPLVTIGAVNFNHARFILETLESIKSQTYPNIQLIIVDDCSTDNSVALVKEWLTTYGRPYQLILHETNQGAIAGVNDVLQNARGTYLSMVATDDLLMPDKISSQVKMFQQHQSDVAMIYGDSMMIDENGNMLRPSMFEHYLGKNYSLPGGYIFKEIINDFFFFWQASLVNLHLFKKIGFQFDKRFIADDWDMELAVSRHYKVYGYKTVQAKYRQVNTGITLTNWVPDKIDKVRKSQFMMIRRYYPHPLNTKEDKFAIIDKLKRLFWEIYFHKNTGYKDRVRYYWMIYRSSLSVKDFAFVAALVFRLDGLRKYLLKFYQKPATA